MMRGSDRRRSGPMCGLVLALVLSAALGACGGDDSPEEIPGPSVGESTTVAPTSTTVVSPAMQAALTAAGTIDFWVTDRFFPGSVFDRQDRACLIRGFVARLKPAEIEVIAFADPRTATLQQIGLVRKVAPVFDTCIDQDAFNVLLAKSFAELQQFDPLCATAIVTSQYSMGSMLSVFFSKPRSTDEPPEILLMRERMKNECAEVVVDDEA